MASKNVRRIAYTKEPTHHGPRYLVTLGRSTKGAWSEKHHYVYSLLEVKEIRAKAKKGHVVEVYHIDYNFREAWEGR